MDHKIIEQEQFTVVGYPVKVSLKDPEFQKKIFGVWDTLMPNADKIAKRSTPEFFGTYNPKEGFEGDEMSFEAIAGVKVDSVAELPEGMKSQVVPNSNFFVVTHVGKIEKVMDTYMAAKEAMISANIQKDNEKVTFELYGERFHHGSDDSEFEIYIPIK